jgi:hypothetical protein
MNITARFAGLVALLGLTALLCGGCSTQMLREGWAIGTSPVGASQMHGFSQPIARMSENGDLSFQYDARVVRYGMLGHWSAPAAVLGMVRLTNFVSRASLCPATNLWRLDIRNSVFPVANEGTSNTAPVILPVSGYQISSNHMIYPSQECILWASDWVWYVPPQHEGDMPKAAILSKDTVRTPGSVYPLRIVLFPVVFVGDVLCWPIVYVATGGNPDF